MSIGCVKIFHVCLVLYRPGSFKGCSMDFLEDGFFNKCSELKIYKKRRWRGKAEGTQPPDLSRPAARPTGSMRCLAPRWSGSTHRLAPLPGLGRSRGRLARCFARPPTWPRPTPRVGIRPSSQVAHGRGCTSSFISSPCSSSSQWLYPPQAPPPPSSIRTSLTPSSPHI